MTFQPIVPISGLAGWVFLNTTMQRQTDLFNKSPELIRDSDYFAQNIGKIETAEALVHDRRLLRVALGAFGLQDDINNRAFIQKILEDGTGRDDSLANKLADDRYKKLANVLGFDRSIGPGVRTQNFAQGIIAQFRERAFEVAVGDQNQSLRLALNAKRELTEIATRDSSENTKWLTVLGQQPLRKVFETLLGLPAGFGRLDLDRQIEIFEDRSSRQLGFKRLEDLADPEILDDLIERFILRDQIASFSVQSSGSIALTLLQNATRSFGGRQ